MQENTMVRRVLAEKKAEFAVEANGLYKDLCADLRVTTLDRLRIFNRYDVCGLSDREYLTAKSIVFAEPPVDHVYDDQAPINDACFVLAVESLPGQYDQRADSAAQCLQILTGGEKPLVRTASVYAFYGSLTTEQKIAIEGYLINPVEKRPASLQIPDSLTDNLQPPDSVETITGFSSLSKEELSQLRDNMGLAMSLDDILFTQKFFVTEKRDPTVTEIRVLDTYWSDHCRHTTFLTELTEVSFSQPDTDISARMSGVYEDYLNCREEVYAERIDNKPVCLMDLATMAMRKLKKDGKLADLDESEEINACSIRVTIEVDQKPQDYIIMFKNETHNHPTEIEPFGGAATCLGGAIRDPLSGRSYVYQAMRVTGAGDPRLPLSQTLSGKLAQKKIVRTAAAGYSSYGNQIGLATGQVDELYHPGYVAKRMEIGAVIGAAPADSIVRKRPVPGDVVILLGGRTGRDGIGGATGSSKVHDEKSVLTCGSEVQKGNPPTERKIQRLFRNPQASRLIIRCNDFGAGGISVAIGELADGLRIDLDAVPKKYDGLNGTELAISESQERMAVVVEPKDVKEFLAYAAEENLEAVPVATVTDVPRMVMTWRNEVIVDLPRSFIDTNGAPSFAKATVTMPQMANFYPHQLPVSYVKENFSESLINSLAALENCSRKGLVQRFDSTIGGNTVLLPFGGKYQLSREEGMVSKIPVLQGQTQAVTVMSYGFDPYLSEWSPFHGAYYAVVESLLKLAAMGADPLTARLTFQEYFERMQTETTWGKPLAALLGAFAAQLDYGTASIGGKDSMSGTFKDLCVPPTLVSFAVATTTADKIISATLTSPGQKIYAVHVSKDSLGLYNKAHLQRVFKVMKELNRRGQILACGVAAQSGIAPRVAQMCLGNRLGFDFSDKNSLQDLFCRSFGTLIVSVRDSNSIEKLEMLGGKYIGQTTSKADFVYPQQSITIAKAQQAFESTLEPIFPTQLPVENILELTSKPARQRVVPHIQTSLSCTRPTVFIPVFPGSNCEYDSVRAYEQAGAEADVMIIRNQTSHEIVESLQEMSRRIDKAQMIMLPGGFSGGDEPEGSGKFIAAAFRNPAVTQAVRELLHHRDGLMLGICNGFQALIKLGLLPFGDIVPLESNSPTLTFNRIGRHQSGYVTTKITSNTSPWLALTQRNECYEIPISHGEGRFFADHEALMSLMEQDQIVTQYVDDTGCPTMDTNFNPNGSVMAIEGIVSPDGRILGKMGHSERVDSFVAKNIAGKKDQQIFLAGVRYFT